MTSLLLSAREAAERLGIKPASLYVYVSRGLLRSEPGPGRSRRYRREDVDRLMAKRDGAEGALDFGAPVLDSALTRIADGQFFYRGRDAVDLAAEASLEDIACLLWPARAAIAFSPTNLPARLAVKIAGGGALSRLQALLPLAAAADPQALSEDRTIRMATCGRLLRFVAATLLGRKAQKEDCDRQLAAAWKLPPKSAALVRAALVLCADHELNPSSFVARCVASTGATLHDAVAAGIAAMQGPRHGGATRRALAWLKESDEARDPAEAIAIRARRGEGFPAFGHPLYPAGDPRARYLLGALKATLPASPERKRLEALADAVTAQTGRHPNIDFALVSLARVLHLPDDAPIQIFTLGRTVGWIAHALEQQDAGKLIRPRARYVGEV